MSFIGLTPKLWASSYVYDVNLYMFFKKWSSQIFSEIGTIAEIPQTEIGTIAEIPQTGFLRRLFQTILWWSLFFVFGVQFAWYVWNIETNLKQSYTYQIRSFFRIKFAFWA